MGGHHSPIRRLVKLHPNWFSHKWPQAPPSPACSKAPFGGKVTATVGVQEMNGRRIIGLIRSLDPPSAIMVLASPTRSLVTSSTEAPVF